MPILTPGCGEPTPVCAEVVVRRTPEIVTVAGRVDGAGFGRLLCPPPPAAWPHPAARAAVTRSAARVRTCMPLSRRAEPKGSPRLSGEHDDPARGHLELRPVEPAPERLDIEPGARRHRRQLRRRVCAV